MVCGTATPVTDEELTLTTTLFNSEDTDATIKSLTYTIGGDRSLAWIRVRATRATRLGQAQTRWTVSFHYTPTRRPCVHRYRSPWSVVEQNGKEYTFTKTIDSGCAQCGCQLVYIGIDASHYNEYVGGQL